MFFPGKTKTIPNVPLNLRDAVIMAVRILEGNNGQNVELVGSQPHDNGCVDIQYRTKKFTEPEEVDRQRQEIERWIQDHPEELKEGLMFLKNALEPLINIAQKLGLGRR